MKPEERRPLQDVINRLHGRFEAVVREGRAEIAEQVAGLADGRIFTADEALELGLVDAVGHLETAIERLDMFDKKAAHLRSIANFVVKRRA